MYIYIYIYTDPIQTPWIPITSHYVGYISMSHENPSLYRDPSSDSKTSDWQVSDELRSWSETCQAAGVCWNLVSHSSACLDGNSKPMEAPALHLIAGLNGSSSPILVWYLVWYYMCWSILIDQWFPTNQTYIMDTSHTVWGNCQWQHLRWKKNSHIQTLNSTYTFRAFVLSKMLHKNRQKPWC